MFADSVKSGQEMTVHLVAPTKQEKAAWITDISQVIAGARQEAGGSEVLLCAVHGQRPLRQPLQQHQQQLQRHRGAAVRQERPLTLQR